VVNSFPSSWTLNHAVYGGHPSDGFRPGLLNDGKVVRNVFAYDADGNPLEGVQLYDQKGEPLAVEPNLVYRMRYGGRLPTVYSWSVGEEGSARKAWNVYPLPVAYDGGRWQRRDRVWTRDEPPFLPQPPLVAVPPAFLPLPDAEESAATDEGESGPEQPRAETEEASPRG
jgi:hypothetical protein